MGHLPNLLSWLRLALGPYLFWLLARRDYSTGLIVVLIVAVTDWADGFLARRLGVQSRFGEMLDPIADKVLLSGAFVTLAVTHSVELWFAAIVLGRDLMILTVAGLLIASAPDQKRRFPPSFWGKASTAVQIAFVVALMLSLAGTIPGFVASVLKGATIVLTLWSGIDYARRAALMPLMMSE